jgi:hypothetical protein
LTGTVSTDPAASIALNITGINLTTGAFTVDVSMTDEFTHTAPASGSEINDFVINNIGILGTDIDGDPATAYVNVEVVDDVPEAGDPQDAILANQLGNQVTGDLDFHVGADEGATYQITNLVHDDPVMNVNGTVPVQVTSNDTPLVWSYDAGTGIWSAVTDDQDADTVFTIQVNADGTYTVDMSDTLQLDGAAGVDVVIGGGIRGGNTDNVALFDVPTKHMVDVDPEDNVPDNAEHMFFIVGSDELGNSSTVNASQTLGVGEGQNISNSLGSQDDDSATSDKLTIWFAEPEDPTGISNPDNDIDTFEPVESLELTLSNWNNQGTTGGHWVAYDSDDNIVGEGDIAHDVTTFIIDTDDTNDGVGLGGTVSEAFTKLELTANYESSYKVAAISSVTEVEGSNVVIDLTAEATDADGDTAEVDFQVTFDADGDIHGDGVNEVISGVGATSIDGGTGEDTVSYEAATAGVTLDLSDTTDNITNIDNIVGSDYADILTGDSNDNIIYGGAGVDTIEGGDGDDTLYGGTGHDSITGGNDADTFGPIEEGAGEVTDYDPTVDLDQLVPDPEDAT